MGVWTVGRVRVQGVDGAYIELESMIVVCCIVPQGCGILVREGEWKQCIHIVCLFNRVPPR